MIDIARDLDLFVEQRIDITRRLKDFSDIATKEGEFTRTFQGPASRKNQAALQNYGVVGTESEFNPHKGIPAQWSFSSFVRFTGRLEVNSVVYKDGKPYAFEFTYYGRQRSLANVFGSDRFSDIDWSEYDHFLTLSAVVVSWAGFFFSGEILYPLVDSRANYFFGPTSLDLPGNIRNANNPILLTDLKPAISVQTFLKKIFSAYGLTLTGDLVDEESDFTRMYVLPNRWSGSGVAAKTFDNNTISYNAAQGDNPYITTPNSEQVVSFPTEVQDENELFNGTTFTANLSGTHTVALSILIQQDPFDGDRPSRYTLRIKKNGINIFDEIIFRNTGLSTVFYYQVPAVSVYLEAGDELEIFFGKIDYTIGIFSFDSRDARILMGQLTILAPVNQLGQTVSLNDQMPDDGITEWLSAFIRSYNMVIIPAGDDDKTWEILSLSEYYAKGTLRDWSGVIDLDNIAYHKPKVYQEVTMKYTESESAVQKAFFDATGRTFGEVNIRPDVEFGESQLEIQNPCTLIPPSLFKEVDASGEATGKIVDVTIHKSINIEGNPTKEPWLLFYFNGTQATSLPYYIQEGFDGPNPVGQLRHDYPKISAVQQEQTDNDSVTLCYSLESDIAAQVAGSTAYKRYWENALRLQYAKESRVVKRARVVLPTLEFYNYNLNDEIFLEGQYWRIEEISHDQEGKNASVTLQSSRIFQPAPVRAVRPGGKVMFDRSPDAMDISASGAYLQDGEYYGSFVRAQVTPNLQLYGSIINNITQVVIEEIEQAGGRFRTWGDEEYDPQS